MPKTTKPAGRTIARALSFALIQARPEPYPPGGPKPFSTRATQMEQWETDVMAVSMALALLFNYDDTRFRRECQGPKGDR